MGYTHYWRVPDTVARADWNAFTHLVGKIIEQTDVSVAADFDDPEPVPPVMDADCVCFNGVGREGHETFFMERTGGQGSCKTARKPYDAVVVACLLAGVTHLPGFLYMRAARANLGWSSDGSPADRWDGYLLYMRAARANLNNFDEQDKADWEAYMSGRCTS
jgi:hypothetical protein